jgi:hypothetical protein
MAAALLAGCGAGRGAGTFIPLQVSAISPRQAEALSSTSGVFLGADCGPNAVVSCANFASTFGHGIAVGTVYATWDDDLGAFIARQGLNAWSSLGIVADITWQPGSATRKITLSSIATGAEDRYIAKSAQELRSFGAPVFLRPFHEFNTPNYPWGLPNNGANAASDVQFIAAWRRVVTIFREQHASNAKFIWCFNSKTNPSASWNLPASAYPGDAYVDWIAFDGFNQGNSTNGKPWVSFAAIVNATYKTAVAVSANKPIMAGEIASNEYGDGGSMKASWIAQMFAALNPATTPYPHLHAVSWFEGDQNYVYDSRSTSPVLQAFTSGIASTRSQGTALFSTTGP